MAGFDRFLSSRLKDLGNTNWDAFVRFLASTIANLEARAKASDDAADKVVQLGLSFINESLGPALLDAAAKQTEIAAIRASCGALQVQIAAILSVLEDDGVSADVVAETATRLFLSPEQAEAWDAKPSTAAVSSLIDAAVASIMGGAAPSTLDTIAEIAAALAADGGAITSLTAAIGGKMAKSANLADLTDTVAARAALGVLSAATIAATYAPLSGGEPQPSTLRWTSAKTLADGSDLNTMVVGGFYETSNWQNGPIANMWAQLLVSPSWNTSHVLQVVTDQDTGRQWRRVRQAGTWEAWQEIGGPLIQIATTLISSPVAYVEHTVDFAKHAFALTLVRNLSVDDGAYHRVGLLNAGGTILDYNQSAAVVNTHHTGASVFWSPEGFMPAATPGGDGTFADATRIRIYPSLGNLDAGFITTYGVRLS